MSHKHLVRPGKRARDDSASQSHTLRQRHGGIKNERRKVIKNFILQGRENNIKLFSRSASNLFTARCLLIFTSER